MLSETKSASGGKNKITLLLIGLLISALFPSTGKTENIGLKIPQMFCFSESFLSYKSSQNTVSITEEISEDAPLEADAGIYAKESSGSGIGSLVGEIPCVFFFLQALGGLCMEDYGKTDFFARLGLVAYGIGAPIGSSVGTVLTGKKLKQKGSFGKAFLGSITGGLAFAALGTIPGIIKKDKGVALIGAAIGWEIGCVLGSVKGYNF
ncbi:MAG: hypothetical protein PHX21_03130 [bacterium]|nr:hypothetical protein [bacterium]